MISQQPEALRHAERLGEQRDFAPRRREVEAIGIGVSQEFGHGVVRGERDGQAVHDAPAVLGRGQAHQPVQRAARGVELGARLQYVELCLRGGGLLQCQFETADIACRVEPCRQFGRDRRRLRHRFAHRDQLPAADDAHVGGLGIRRQRERLRADQLPGACVLAIGQAAARSQQQHVGEVLGEAEADLVGLAAGIGKQH